MANINFSDPELMGTEIVGAETLGQFFKAFKPSGIMPLQETLKAAIKAPIIKPAAPRAAQTAVILTKEGLARKKKAKPLKKKRSQAQLKKKREEEARLKAMRAEIAATGALTGAYGLRWNQAKVEAAVQSGKVDPVVIQAAVAGQIPAEQAQAVHSKVHGGGMMKLALPAAAGIGALLLLRG
jgi:hypothetical protein